MEDILLCLIACTNTRMVRGTSNVWDRGRDFPLTSIVLLLFLPVDQDIQFEVNPECTPEGREAGQILGTIMDLKQTFHPSMIGAKDKQ